MIICGYPCIGKTSIAKNSKTIIDLESSYFKVEGRDNTNWEDGYCRLANQLSSNHVVFVSSHKTVRDTLNKLGFEFSVCYPALDIKDLWVNRVTDRATRTALWKDKLAADRVINHYDEDIRDLMNTKCSDHIIITREDLDDPEGGLYSLLCRLLSKDIFI